MFVSIVLNTEYLDINTRDRWFLKNLYHCYENKWILITHEYLWTHIHDYMSNIPDNQFRDFEMRRLSQDEIDSVEIYTIPDSVFNKIEQEHNSRSGALTYLSKDRDEKLHVCYNVIFSTILKKHPDEVIQGVFHCLEADKTIRSICAETQTPLISYIFSAFRKPHGYQQTLYCSSIDGLLFDDSESKVRYNTFIKEDNFFPVLDHKELVALLGKTRTLPLLQLIDHVPSYELGVCCECFSILPHVYERHKYTDDDVFYKANTLYTKDKITVRSHSLQLDEIHVNRSEIRNDPATFILSCKRLITVRSQIILKALLWGRTAIMERNTLPYSFVCQSDLTGTETVELNALNFLIFGYLIPSGLMFSDEYWKWRLTRPTETQIYQRHLDYLLNELNIDKEMLLSLRGKELLRYILKTRNCDEQLVENILSERVIKGVNWDAALSRFDIMSENGFKSYWRIDTENDDGTLTTVLSIDVKEATVVKFYPLDDVSGFTKLNAIVVDGQVYNLAQRDKQFRFMPKNQGSYTLNLCEPYNGKLTVQCTWEYKKVFDYLNK